MNQATITLVYDECVSTSIMHTCVSQMMLENVKACNCNHNGKHVVCLSVILILCTHPNDVKFSFGEVTPLTANAVAQAMYTQCNVEGNKYL